MLAWNIKPVNHRWNQHGLEGDNIEGIYRNLHPGPISSLSLEREGKPWLRSEARKPCALLILGLLMIFSRSSTHPLFLSGSLSAVELKMSRDT